MQPLPHRTSARRPCPRRRVGIALAAGLALAGCGAGQGEAGSGDTAPDEGTAPPAVSAPPAEPVDVTPEDDEAEDQELTDGLPEGCGRIFTFPDDPVDGELFADCTATAMELAGSYRLVQEVDGHTWDRRVRLGPDFALEATSSTGEAVVVRDGLGWALTPQGWVQPYPEHSPEEFTANLLVVAGKEGSEPALHRAYWGTAPQYVPLGPRDIDGVRTFGYQGTPSGLGVGDVNTFDIWIDRRHLPIRVESTVSALGVTMDTLLEFSAWGETVEVELPEGAEPPTD